MGLPSAQEPYSSPYSWVLQVRWCCLSPLSSPAFNLLAAQGAVPVYPVFKTSAGEGIAGAVTHYYGKKIGSLITTLYFIAFFVVVLICAVAITNSLTEQLAKHITIDLRIRMLVSLGVVLVLNLIFLMGRQATIRVMGFLVFPLIAYFLFLSLYLTGSWQPTLLTGQMSVDQHTLHQVWISIPVMVSLLAIRQLSPRSPLIDVRNMASRPWVNAKKS